MLPAHRLPPEARPRRSRTRRLFHWETLSIELWFKEIAKRNALKKSQQSYDVPGPNRLHAFANKHLSDPGGRVKQFQWPGDSKVKMPRIIRLRRALKIDQVVKSTPEACVPFPRDEVS
jgi:hypothetical protein